MSLARRRRIKRPRSGATVTEMGRHILIVQGHPDHQARHFGHALAQAYAEGAKAGGHAVETIEVAALDFPLLRRKEDWQHGEPPEVIRLAQDSIARADHLVILYPLWLGTMPALLKAFLEQVLRPGFAIGEAQSAKQWDKRLTGKSARVVVTMGMPALFYRWYFRAHSLKSLERNILRFCGIAPIKESLIGLVESPNGARREKWLAKMRELGRRAA